jgi:hypothetical protein
LGRYSKPTLVAGILEAILTKSGQKIIKKKRNVKTKNFKLLYICSSVDVEKLSVVFKS